MLDVLIVQYYVAAFVEMRLCNFHLIPSGLGETHLQGEVKLHSFSFGAFALQDRSHFLFSRFEKCQRVVFGLIVSRYGYLFQVPMNSFFFSPPIYSL